jgi:uncharacterized phage protein (TIGR02220 family)
MNQILIINKTIEYLSSITKHSYNNKLFEKDENLIKLTNQGYNYDDFKKVIDKKWKQWKGTQFEKYVRPSTLFGNKFESYLNEQSNSEAKISKLFDSVEQAKRTDWKLD